MVMDGPDNPRDFDQFTKGMVHAFNEVLEIEPAIILEETGNDSEVQSNESSGESGY